MVHQVVLHMTIHYMIEAGHQVLLQIASLLLLIFLIPKLLIAMRQVHIVGCFDKGLPAILLPHAEDVSLLNLIIDVIELHLCLCLGLLEL